MSVRGIKRAHILCSSLAFYDFEPILNAKIKSWFDYCLSLSEKVGHPIDEGSCDPGNTKYVLIRNCRKALEKNASNLKYLCLRTSAKEDIGSYGELFADLVNSQRYSFWGMHHDFIEFQKISEIGEELCKIICPKYGFFYKIPFVYSPAFYVTGAMGLGELDTYKHSKFYNPKHVDFQKRAAKWAALTNTFHNSITNKVYNLCSDGHIREVYPVNFINKNHLSYKVFSKATLKDWIEEKDHRGSLRQITEELWRWTIDEADLEPVTIALASSDIILCVNKENPHRYDYGVRLEDQIRPESWDYWREVANREL